MSSYSESQFSSQNPRKDQKLEAPVKSENGDKGLVIKQDGCLKVYLRND